MLKHAQDLEFEEAAHVRDQLHQLRQKTVTGLKRLQFAVVHSSTYFGFEILHRTELNP